MEFEIHAIDRDNGDGRYNRRHAFAAPAQGVTNHMHPELDNLVMHQDVYGGTVGTVEAPDGSAIGETASGALVLVLPDGTCLDADDVVASARSSRPWLRMEMKFIEPSRE